LLAFRTARADKQEMTTMDSRATLFGQLVHTLLAVVPFGLLGASGVADVTYLISGHPDAASMACSLIGAGLVAGALAAPWSTLYRRLPPGTPSCARRIAAVQGLGHVLGLLLFGLSWWGRHDHVQAPPVLAYGASFAGAGVLLVMAWLGRELVERLGADLTPHADVDARGLVDGPTPPTDAAAPAQAPVR